MKTFLLLIFLNLCSTLAICQASMDLTNEAKIKADSGDFPSAIDLLNKAIEIDPINEDAYAIRGNILYILDLKREAILNYSQAAKINPNNFSNFLLRGITKSKMEDYRGAIVDFNKSLELKPDEDLAYFERGMAKASLRDNGALKDLDKAIELNPDNPEYFFARGLLRIIVFLEINAGCLDLSKAGELGHLNAYSKIRELCK